MTWALDQIWRYPIKGIGAERLRAIALSTGLPLPLDRAWAALEDGGDASDGWRSCRNFLRGAKRPSLMAITCAVDGDLIHLQHPDRPDISILPGRDDAALFDWLATIYPSDRPKAVALVQSPAEGMADVSFASISILNPSSLRALGQKLGQDLDRRRFRGNLWVDGLGPWEEFDLVGKTLHIGKTRLEVMETITRCRSTEANPATGQRDVNTLQALQDGWGHQDFGVNAMVRIGGQIKTGDKVTLQ